MMETGWTGARGTFGYWGEERADLVALPDEELNRRVKQVEERDTALRTEADALWDRARLYRDRAGLFFPDGEQHAVLLARSERYERQSEETSNELVALGPELSALRTEREYRRLHRTNDRDYPRYFDTLLHAGEVSLDFPLSDEVADRLIADATALGLNAHAFGCANVIEVAILPLNVPGESLNRKPKRCHCHSCHERKQAAGLYGPRCPNGEHDMPRYLSPAEPYYCLKCGESETFYD